jgi:hypothetical protein
MAIKGRTKFTVNPRIAEESLEQLSIGPSNIRHSMTMDSATGFSKVEADSNRETNAIFNQLHCIPTLTKSSIQTLLSCKLPFFSSQTLLAKKEPLNIP